MAAQALSFCSNLWSSSSSSSNSTLQQHQQNQYVKPNTLSFQHQRKRPRASSSSSSLSISPSSNPHYHNNNNNNPFTPLQSNYNDNSLFSHQNSFTTIPNSFTNNPTNSLFHTTTFFEDPPSAPLGQEDYYHHYNSLEFLDEYPNNNVPNIYNVPDPINPDFSSLEDQILLAPFLAEPLDDFPAPLLQDQTTNEDMYIDTISSDYYHCQPTKKPCGEGVTSSITNTTTMVSPQSIAARERRRKISERTSELGKLIPGGNKMTTAEMFQAAHKYVKFLQAQVSVLQLLSSHNQEEKFYIKDLQVLASPIIQEKLYSEEKCLVPRELVDRTIGKNRFPLADSV